MINVIHDEISEEYVVFLDLPQDRRYATGNAILAIHKREKTALALARRALVNAIMAVEQKERKLK